MATSGDQMKHDTKDLSVGRPRFARSVGVVGAAAALALVASACSPSDSGGSSGDSGLSGTVEVTSIQDLTGAVGPVGISTQNGMKLAEKQINDSGMLGGAKLKISYKDTQTKSDQAASLMSSTVSTDVTAIFGPVSSQEAVVVAPIGQSAKIPTIFTQAGSKGVVDVGDYVFRVTAPQQYYQPKMAAYLKSQGINTVVLLRKYVAGTSWERSGDIPVDSLDYRSVFAVGALLFIFTFALNAFSIRMVRKFREVYE